MQKVSQEGLSGVENDFFSLKSRGSHPRLFDCQRPNTSSKVSLALSTNYTKRRCIETTERVGTRSVLLKTTPTARNTNSRPDSTSRFFTNPSPGRLSRTSTMKNLFEAKLPQTPKKDVRTLCSSLGFDKFTERRRNIASRALHQRQDTRATRHKLTQYTMTPFNTTMIETQTNLIKTNSSERIQPKHDRSVSIKKDRAPINIHMERLNELRSHVKMPNFSYYVKNSRKLKPAPASSSVKARHDEIVNLINPE